MTVALLHGYVVHESDAWHYTIDELGRYFERVLSGRAGAMAAPPAAAGALVELAGKPIPPLAQELIGSYLQAAARMGQRTAELHLALVSRPADAAFAPEPFTELYQRSLVQSMRNLTRQSLQRLRRRLRTLPEDARGDAQKLLQLEAEIIKKARVLLQRRFTAVRTRYHGMLHLGPGAVHGEGLRDPDVRGRGRCGRPADRRVKRSPLRDVASMLRSLHYAAAHEFATGGQHRLRAPRRTCPALEPWARFWRTLGLGGVPAGLPRRRRRSALRAEVPRGAAGGPRRLPAGEGARTRSASSSTRAPTGCASRSSESSN